MAQAYVTRVTQRNKHLKNQIDDLRRTTFDIEFSDCDEQQLFKAAEEIEHTINRKRKLECFNNTDNKKSKQDYHFVCDLCDKVYKHKSTLTRHKKTHPTTFSCDKCNESFKYQSSLKRHKSICGKVKSKLSPKQIVTSTINNKEHTCNHCGIPFTDYNSLYQHVIANHPLNQSGGDLPQSAAQAISTPTTNNNNRYRFRKSAVNNTVNQVDIIPHANEKYDLLQFLANAKDDVEKELMLQQGKQRSMKWYINARVEMVRDVEDERQEKAHPHFRSKVYISLPDENNEHNLNESFQAVNRAMEEFINKGSNWILNKIISLEVNTLPYSPIAGSSYMELPRKIRYTGGIINIRNYDQRCFLYSILAGLHEVPNHPERVSHYDKYENELNMKGIDYPVILSKLETFEKQNNISVNVFGFEEGEAFPLYLSKIENGTKEVDLLYITNENQSHYCLIKNLDRFLGSMTRFHNKRFYCRRCLHGFVRHDLLVEHRRYCNKFDFQRITYPTEGKNDILEFKDYGKMLRVPFVIYADFECYAKKIDTCLPNPEHSSTTHQTKFEACGYSYIVVSSNQKYTKKPVVYRGDDAVQHFFEDMLKEEEYISEKLDMIEPLIMNETTENAFQNATHCFLCKESFTDKRMKVRDHDHLGVKGDSDSPDYSNFRGAAHVDCNLSLRMPKHFIPVYFHNLRNFDAHILLSEAGKYKEKKLTCIPNNMEKYISFSLGKLRFLDTYQCMASSLETLVDNLAANGLTHFKQFQKTFPDDDIAKLLLQKNEYCYDYVDCSEKFKETELPPKEAFFNSLTKEPISDEKYKHAQTVWNALNIKNLGEFHDLYVLTDTLLLSDVFERFRDMTLQNYELDASHFYTSPGLAWQAALKMSGVCLDLITDPLMYNMLELGTRGGVSMVSKKHSKANHTLLDDYDESLDAKHIMYYDATNLYGFSMKNPLPTGFFHFLTESEIETFNLQNIAPDAREGYILEVDLDYPSHLHEHHNCYPLAPEHVLIEQQDLSPYSQQLWTKLNGDKRTNIVKKLIPTLKNKQNYVVHYRNLQLYVELGMKITKVHRVLGFHQMPWLQTYIDFNANMRKNAKNDFEKDFFKLMCNSVFGKCLENLRERISLSLVHSEEKLKKCVAKPSFERFQIFNENLVGVVNKQVNLVLNKPIYAGQAILDLSKRLMYEFHYKIIKPKYGDRIKLLFTDTDSLCYEIGTQDVYRDMEIYRQHFDTSNYSMDHFLYSNENKKVPGKFKDELGGIPIKEFVGLRPKMYSFTYDVVGKNVDGKDISTEKEKKVAKGVVKCEIEKTLRHKMYRDCLFQETKTMNSMRCIRSKNHELYMDLIVKNSLCGFDSKRYWTSAIESLSFGHCKINNQ